ncbi:O-antigen ligase family protein [Desulfoplanes sp. PS50]
MLLVFSGSWHYGIEITRYIIIPLCLAFLYFFPEQRKKFLTSKELWILTAFLGTACIGLLVGHQSLRGIDRILNWILALGAGFTAAAILGDKKSRLLAALPLGLLGYTLGAILLHTFDYIDMDILKTSRLILFYADGTQANRLIILCGTGVLSLFFIAIESTEKKFVRIFCIFGAAILFILSFLTNARSGFFALLVAAAIMIIFTFKKNIKKIIFAGAILALITICIAQFSPKQPSPRRYANVITNIKTDISFRQRFFIWDSAWNIFSKNLFFGHGFATFHKAYQNEYSAAKKSPNFKKKYPCINPSTNNAHNFILHFLAETGIIGCLLMLGFWGIVIWQGFWSSSMLGGTIACVFILSFIEFQLNMNLYDRHVSTVLFAYAGILANLENT